SGIGRRALLSLTRPARCGLARRRARLTGGGALGLASALRRARGARGPLSAVGSRSRPRGALFLRAALAIAARSATSLGRRCLRPLNLGLTVRADAPLRVERLAAGAARLLQLALAVRAAHVVELDRILAVRARLLDQLPDPQLGGPDLEVALVDIVEKLRGPQDRVDDRADKRKE